MYPIFHNAGRGAYEVFEKLQPYRYNIGVMPDIVIFRRREYYSDARKRQQKNHAGFQASPEPSVPRNSHNAGSTFISCFAP
jgi:hypothetical protein